MRTLHDSLALAAAGVARAGASPRCGGDRRRRRPPARRPARSRSRRPTPRARSPRPRSPPAPATSRSPTAAPRSPSSTSTPPGDRVMGEVENIGPGLTRELHVELPAGTYETACKPGMIGKGIRGAFTVTGAAAPLDRRRRSWPTATASYQRYVKSQTDALLVKTAGVRRRGQGRRRREGQGAVPGRPHLLGAHRAGRRDLRRPRPEDRRPRGGHRGGHGVHRLPPDREGPLGDRRHLARPARSPTS